MKRNEINIRDPFVLPYQGVYYLYGTRGATCWGKCTGFDVYTSTDLEEWEGPIEVFHKPEGFWADQNYWAPEVHVYDGNFYAFVSFKADGVCRGTQILKSDSPLGPFHVHSPKPITPADWECLDGTFYVDKNGEPYMIFCHEWVQVRDGQMCAVKLSKDLTHPVTEPVVLFTAGTPTWAFGVKNGPNFVTDGPYMYRMKNGELIMLWASFSKEGYAQAIARSDNGEITGNWSIDEDLLYEKDGGHGMLFTSFDGDLYLTLHTPNEPLTERPIFTKVFERGNTIKRN